MLRVLSLTAFFMLSAVCCGGKEVSPEIVTAGSEHTSSDVGVETEDEQWNPNLKSEKVSLPIDSETSPVVEVFHYHPTKVPEGQVIAQFEKGLLDAIAHKARFPEDQVRVRLAVYKIGLKIYFGTNPEKQDLYLKAKGSDFDGDDTEKFITTVLRAYQAGVDIQMVYHNPDDDKGIAEFLGENYSKIARRVNWGIEGRNQMHSKFMTARIVRSEMVLHTSLFVATSNMDEFGDDGQPLFKVAQTGVLITGHTALENAHQNFFEVLWRNAESQSSYQAEVRKLHLENALNYNDGTFGAYFFPIPEQNFEPGDDYKAGWVSRYNPVTALTNKVKDSQAERHIKVTAYYCGSSAIDAFVKKLADSFTSSHETQTKLLHIRSAIYSKHKEPMPNCLIPAFDGQSRETVLTHEKNMMFAFGSPVTEFYSLTGSANLGVSEYTSKANNILTIKETSVERKVYSMFKNSFYSAYDE